MNTNNIDFLIEPTLEHYWFQANEIKPIEQRSTKVLKTILAIVLALSCFSCLTPAPAAEQRITADQVKQYTCIKEALHYEARGEHQAGMQAVLSVIHNRTKHKEFPKTYCDVIKQPMQFSYRNGFSSKETRLNAFKPANTRSEQQASTIASDLAYRAAMGRFKPSMQPQVLYYCSTKITPTWSKKMKTYATIGNHRFFAT